MTGLEAVTAVSKHIKLNSLTVFGYEDGSVFKYEKEIGFNGEYIAVNNLPFVHKDDVQVCTVNINIHVPKLTTGQPDIARLSEITNNVITLFDSLYGTFIDGAYFKFYSDSRPVEDNDNTYYVNIELDCTFENISKE